VVLEERAERCWRAVVKEDEHLTVSGRFETACCKIQD
jgi:hypothetical protein